MVRRWLFVVCALSLFTSAGARAEESASPVKLELKTAATGSWWFKIANEGDSPVRIAADARLLSLEITPPGGTAVRCALPADARPSTDEGSELVVPGKRSWSALFDPLFYCFGARERAALVKDAQVKARFGWTTPVTKAKTPPAPSPPFAVTPVGASVGKLTPEKELEAASVTLTDTMSMTRSAEPPTSDVYLTVPETMDAAKGGELSTTVSLVNESDRPITLLFRPDMVTFSVSGPSGSVSCGTPKSIGSPIKELFITVGVKGKASLNILFTATCAPGTFDVPGLYRVTPKLDNTNASGRSINVRSWDGVATAKAPLLLRVRQPKQPTLTGPRPALD